MINGAADGSLTVETRSGTELATATAPVMYDAGVTAAGAPAEVLAVDSQVTPTTNGAELTLSPDAAFLSDPETVYPVTIDPVVSTQWTMQDTWVDSGNPTASNVSSTELRAGTPDNGAHIYRSYMVFWNEAWFGNTINAATLKMANFSTSSCTTGDIRAYRVTTAWNSGITWNTKPGATATDQAAYLGGKGGTGCPEGWLGWDITNIVSGWSSGAYPNYGLRVGAASETGTNTYRRFWSIEHGTDAEPMLSVNYTLPDVIDPCATGALSGPACDVDVTLSESTEYQDSASANSEGSANTDVVYSEFNADGTLDMPGTLAKVRTLYTTNPAYSSMTTTQVDSAVESARQAYLNAAPAAAAGWSCNYSYKVSWLRKKRLRYLPYAADVHISAATSCSGIRLVSCSVWGWVALGVPSVMADASMYSSSSHGCFLDTNSVVTPRPTTGYLMIQMVGPGQFKLISSRPHNFTIT